MRKRLARHNAGRQAPTKIALLWHAGGAASTSSRQHIARLYRGVEFLSVAALLARAIT